MIYSKKVVPSIFACSEWKWKFSVEFVFLHKSHIQKNPCCQALVQKFLTSQWMKWAWSKGKSWQVAKYPSSGFTGEVDIMAEIMLFYIHSQINDIASIVIIESSWWYLQYNISSFQSSFLSSFLSLAGLK